jgi:hypothetical protein
MKKPEFPTKTKPVDGAKAFHLGTEMEEDLNDIERYVDLLNLVSEGQREHAGAFYAIANGIEAALDRAEEKRAAIWGATWGYEFNPRIEAAESPPRPEVIARLEGITKQWKRETKAAKRKKVA